MEQESSATTPRASRTEVLLSSLAALLIIASAILLIVAGATSLFCGASHRYRSHCRVRLAASPRGFHSRKHPRTPDNSGRRAATVNVDGAQSPLTSEAQRSGSAPPAPPSRPPAATATAPATPTSPAATEKTFMSSRPPASEQRTNAATTPQSTEPAGTQKTTVQPSVRDQAAALPDRPAATPKKENVFIVMRGPAKIRSDPGKKGRVIGTAPKNATVKELDRAGNWVQIETEVGTGWIHAALLGLADPVASRAER